MDQIILYLAATLGINPLLLPVYLGLIVAVANLLGKSIPASAEGPLGLLRGVLLVIGLYKPQQITANVTTKTVAKAIASEVSDNVLRTAAATLPAAIESGASSGLVGASLGAPDVFARGAAKARAKSRTVSSHWIAGILALLMGFVLVGCTTAQQARVETTLNAVCTSAPLAQALYNTAVASGDNDRVNRIINYIQATCPTLVILVHTIPVQAPAPAVAVGERG